MFRHQAPICLTCRVRFDAARYVKVKVQPRHFARFRLSLCTLDKPVSRYHCTKYSTGVPFRHHPPFCGCTFMPKIIRVPPCSTCAPTTLPTLTFSLCLTFEPPVIKKRWKKITHATRGHQTGHARYMRIRIQSPSHPHDRTQLRTSYCSLVGLDTRF